MASERGQEVPSIKFNERITKAQKAVSLRKWTLFKQLFEEEPRDLLKDFDLFRNTAINVATHSNKPKLLRELLEMLPTEEDRWSALTRRNEMEETLLHEVAMRDDEAVEMVDVVFEFEMKVPPLAKEEGYVQLVEIKNRKGETPLYKAAKYGNLEMVKLMAKHIAEQKVDMEIHLRSTKRTILHATVQEECFDVALWIMTRMLDDDKTRRSLASVVDEKEFTCLHILAKKPHAFRSHDSMGCFSKLLYNRTFINY